MEIIEGEQTLKNNETYKMFKKLFHYYDRIIEV